GTNSLLLKALNPALGDTLDTALSNANVTPTPPSIPMLDCAAALRVKAALFGHNIPISPLPEIFEKEIESAFLQIGSRIGALAAHLQDITKHFPLDAKYDQITVGSWVAVENLDSTGTIIRTFHQVTDTKTITLAPLDFLSRSVISGLEKEFGNFPGLAQQILTTLAIATDITLLTLDPAWLPREGGKDRNDLFTILRTTTI